MYLTSNYLVLSSYPLQRKFHRTAGSSNLGKCHASSLLCYSCPSVLASCLQKLAADHPTLKHNYQSPYEDASGYKPQTTSRHVTG